LILTFIYPGSAEYLNQHSEKINQQLEQEFEDWDFFADDSDNRVWLNCVPVAFLCYTTTNTRSAA
jgi:hypothetical protein